MLVREEIESNCLLFSNLSKEVDDGAKHRVGVGGMREEQFG